MSTNTRTHQALAGYERVLLGPLIFVVRACIVTLSLAVWCGVVLPIWLFLVLRSVAVLALNNVVNVWRGAGTIDVARFEDVVAFWPRGLLVILRILGGDYDSGNMRPRHPLEPLQETLLSILFYTVLIISFELARDYAWLILRARDAVLPHVEAASLALFDLVRSTPLPF